jgi:hypothetical protein
MKIAATRIVLLFIKAPGSPDGRFKPAEVTGTSLTGLILVHQSSNRDAFKGKNESGA